MMPPLPTRNILDKKIIIYKYTTLGHILQGYGNQALGLLGKILSHKKNKMDAS